MNPPPDPHLPPPIDYASVSPPRRRVSKLAISSLVLAVLTSPCLLGPLDEVLDGRLPSVLEALWFLALLWTLVLVLAIIAMMRISRFKETKAGIRIAVVAIVISLFWVTLMSLTFLFEIPPQD
jgi:hypothetical protein